MRLTASVDATILYQSRHLAGALGPSKADLRTFVPGWQKTNGVLFWAASWEGSQEWIDAAKGTLVEPPWDTEGVVDMDAARLAQAALETWFPSDNKPLPQATEGVLTVIGGMAPLDAMAAMGLERVQEEVL